MQTNCMKRLGVGLVVCAAVALSSWPIKASHAQYDFQLTVDGTDFSCDYAGLSAAIDAVNEAWRGVITLNCPGQNIYFPPNGAKHILGGLVLDGLDANSARLDVAAGVDTQFFIIEPSASVILRNITLQNAKHVGNGGAILIKDQGQLALENSVIAYCEAMVDSGYMLGRGGAIYMEGEGWVVLRSSELNGNFAHAFAHDAGAAIAAPWGLGNVVLANSKLFYNGQYDHPGSIIVANSVQIVSSHVENNRGRVVARAGIFQIESSNFQNNVGVSFISNVVTVNNSLFQGNWDVFVDDGNITITHSEFSGNGRMFSEKYFGRNVVIDTSVFVGNGYANDEGEPSSNLRQVPTTIQNSIFSDHVSQYTLSFGRAFTLTNVSFVNNRGGLQVEGGTGFLDNVTFSQTGTEDIYADCAALTIANSTISHYSTKITNYGQAPAAIANVTCPSPGVPNITLKNTVIDAPVGVKACDRIYPVPNDILGDLSVASDNSCKGYVGVSRTLIKLGPLQDNGGQMVGAPGRERPLLTHMPLPGSVLIDGGGLCSPFDARGFSRGLFMCDIGAVEVGATAP